MMKGFLNTFIFPSSPRRDKIFIGRIACLILVSIFFILLHSAFGQESNVVEEVQKQARSWWSNSQVYVGVILLVFIISSVGYVIRLFKKDKLLKKLLNKYVVFQMKDGRRYRGTMRLEITGMEIISEESRNADTPELYLHQS